MCEGFSVSLALPAFVSLGLPLSPSVPLTRWFSLQSSRLDFSPRCFTFSQFASSFFPQRVSYKVTSRRPLSVHRHSPAHVIPRQCICPDLNLLPFSASPSIFSLDNKHNSPCVSELFSPGGLNFFHRLRPAHCYSRTVQQLQLGSSQALTQQCPRTDIQTFSKCNVCSLAAETLQCSTDLQEKKQTCVTQMWIHLFMELKKKATEFPHKNQQYVKFLGHSMLTE